MDSRGEANRLLMHRVRLGFLVLWLYWVYCWCAVFGLQAAHINSLAIQPPIGCLLYSLLSPEQFVNAYCIQIEGVSEQIGYCRDGLR